MNNEKMKIDMNNFPRKALFDYMIKFNQTRCGITTKVDITDLYDFCKTHKFFTARFIYAITRACNSVENFRQVAVDEKTLYQYKFLHAANVFLTKDNQIRIGVIDINQPIDEFISEYSRVKEEIERTGKQILGDSDGNYVLLSNVKWFQFSCVCECSLNKFESEPEITWDKIEVKDGRATVNMSITFNHALCDGYHVYLFLEALKKEMKALTD